MCCVHSVDRFSGILEDRMVRPNVVRMVRMVRGNLRELELHLYFIQIELYSKQIQGKKINIKKPFYE